MFQIAINDLCLPDFLPIIIFINSIFVVNNNFVNALLSFSFVKFIANCMYIFTKNCANWSLPVLLLNVELEIIIQFCRCDHANVSLQHSCNDTMCYIRHAFIENGKVQNRTERV